MLTAAHRRCAVLGSPIGHSLSPVLHRAAYDELGLDWSYDAVEVTESSLADFLAGLGPEWRGLSLTMPLKRAVLPLLDEVSETARTAGAANTVLLDEDGRRRGHNTDVPGLVQALRERGITGARSAVVVGGGATATSALLALTALGCAEATVLVREPRRAQETVEAMQRVDDPPAVRVVRLDEREAVRDLDVDVAVSTVPAAAQRAWSAWLVARAAVVFDVVYDPWPTPLAESALRAGRTLVSGLDLLVHQATRQVELMTGCSAAPLSAMRAAGRHALGHVPGSAG